MFPTLTWCVGSAAAASQRRVRSRSDARRRSSSGVEEPVREELELEVAQAVLVEQLRDLAECPGLEDVLEVGVPEPDPAEADAGGLGCSDPRGRRGSTPGRSAAPRGRTSSSRARAVRRRPRAERNGLAGAVQPFSLDTMAADYVIVGAGSAGCVLAARLTEDPDVAGGAARGGRPGHRARDPRAGDVPDHVQVEPRLGSARRAGARSRRPAAVPAARPHDRRLQLDQRDDLPPRQPARLRRLGRGGLRRAGATTRC